MSFDIEYLDCFIFVYKIFVKYIKKNKMSVFKPDIYKGKIVLISGGATGICYQISKQFLLHGATVYIISRKIDNINKALESLKK